jgi:hypothetical protein
MPAGAPQLTEPARWAPGARGTRTPQERAALGRAARAHAPGRATPCGSFVRQLWDWKLAADADRMSPAAMRVYGEACAWTVARSHARTGDAIGAYLGTSALADVALATFAEAYADQTERDHAAFCAAGRRRPGHGLPATG